MSFEDRTQLPEKVPLPLPQPRPLTEKERSLIHFLLAGPLGRDELHQQAETAKVDGICSCGCRSVWLDVDPSSPTAIFEADKLPLRRNDWVPITAVQRTGRGATEVTLHVVEGRLFELEIWAGRYGVRPRVDLTKLEREKSS